MIADSLLCTGLTGFGFPMKIGRSLLVMNSRTRFGNMLSLTSMNLWLSVELMIVLNYGSASFCLSQLCWSWLNTSMWLAFECWSAPLFWNGLHIYILWLVVPTLVVDGLCFLPADKLDVWFVKLCLLSVEMLSLTVSLRLAAATDILLAGNLWSIAPFPVIVLNCIATWSLIEFLVCLIDFTGECWVYVTPEELETPEKALLVCITCLSVCYLPEKFWLAWVADWLNYVLIVRLADI